MKKEEALKKIKELLNFSTDVAPVNFVDVKDVDGNILRTASEELVVGDELLVVSENGENLSPDSTFILEDGRTVVTDSESKISEIIEVTDVVDEAVVDEIMSEDVVDTLTDEVVEVEDTVDNAQLESRISQLEELIKELVKNQGNIAEATMSIATLVEKFGGTPVGDEIEDLRSSFSSTKIEKQDSKSIRERNLESIRNMRSKK